MNETIERIYDEAHSAWRFRWIGLAVAAVVALVGWTVVFALPDKYEARASIFVDTRTALQPALQGLTVEQDVNVQLNYVRQSLLSGDSLEKLARESGVLTADITDPRQIATILTELSERVVLRVASTGNNSRDTAGSVYGFTYQDGTRERSLKVIDTVVNNFVEETLGGKRRGSEGALKFVEEQLREREQSLRDVENRLAEFKKKNIGLMPTEQGGYFNQLQLAMDRAKTAENELNVALSRRAELSRQLRGETAIGAAGSGPTVSGGVITGGNDTLSRIQETQARLDDLLLRFTDKHPDVVAARNTLKDLNARRESEIESIKRGDAAAAAASGVTTNPVYQSIQLQLNETDVQIASLRGQLQQQRAKAAELRQMLDTAPQVEAEYFELTRDYDTKTQLYEAILANYEKLRLGDQADSAGSVRFEVVQPPTAPFAPVSPKRSLLLAGILILAFGLGGGIAYGLHLFHPVVGSQRGLSTLTDLPIIGVVSSAFPAQLRARARGQLIVFLGACSTLVVAFGVVIVLNRVGFRIGASAAGVTL